MKTKKMMAIVAAAVMAMGAMAGCGSSSAADPDKGKVYFVNNKKEIVDQLEDLADQYTKETGVQVKVLTAADGYDNTLASELAKTEAPTMWSITGYPNFIKWKDYMEPVQDSAAFKLLTDEGKANSYQVDGNHYTLPYAAEWYGIIYNKKIVNDYASKDYAVIDSADDIKDWDTFKAVVEDMQAHKDDLGIEGAMATPGLESSDLYRFASHMTRIPLFYEYKEAFRCLVWVGLSGGDGAEVEFAAGQVDHGAEVVHVLESAGSGLDVLDDAVESFEDRVGVGVVEVGEDVPPVAAYLAGELFHGFESGARHPRAQTLEGRLGLGSIGAGVVDVLEGLAHLTGASGFQSSPLQAALGFQLQAGQVRFVPQPQVLGPLEQRVAAGLLFADLVDGLVGVFDHVELVDDSRRVGQPLADALGEPQAHVAGNQTHPVGIAVVVHEIPREPFDRGRVLARDHADYVALHQVGDHGDVPVALPAGLVDAYGLHARVVLAKPRLVHVMADEPPQAGVMFADLLGDVRDRLAFGQLHDHRLEQEREPASRPRPRHRDRVHAVGGARHARHARVNERLVLEEVQMPPHALPRVMHRTRGLAAPRFRAGEPRTRREPDRDMQFPSAVLLVTELHARHPPRVRQLQGGGEQRRGIHTPQTTRPAPPPPPDPLTHTKQRKAKTFLAIPSRLIHRESSKMKIRCINRGSSWNDLG